MGGGLGLSLPVAILAQAQYANSLFPCLMALVPWATTEVSCFLPSIPTDYINDSKAAWPLLALVFAVIVGTLLVGFVVRVCYRKITRTRVRELEVRLPSGSQVTFHQRWTPLRLNSAR